MPVRLLSFNGALDFFRKTVRCPHLKMPLICPCIHQWKPAVTRTDISGIMLATLLFLLFLTFNSGQGLRRHTNIYQLLPLTKLLLLLRIRQPAADPVTKSSNSPLFAHFNSSFLYFDRLNHFHNIVKICNIFTMLYWYLLNSNISCCCCCRGDTGCCSWGPPWW